jgi:hypothetical protein
VSRPCPAGGRRTRAADRLVASLAVLTLVSGCGPAGEDPDNRDPVTAEVRVSEAVRVDGTLDEWSTSTSLGEGSSSAAGRTVDLNTVRAQDDPYWLYLAIELDPEVNAQTLPGSLHVLVDADGDAGTGGDLFGTPGTEIDVVLSHVTGRGENARGLGAAIRSVRSDGPGPATSAYALGVVVAPTWASRTFELRIGRLGAPDAGLPRLDGPLHIRLVYEERGVVIDQTPTSAYEPQTEAAVGVPPIPEADALERMARPERTVRVAQWNVSDGSFRRRPDDFARLLAALEPDVVLLDELPGDTEAPDMERFFGHPVLSALGSWSFALGISGGRQRSVVGARNLEVRPATRLLDLQHAPAAITALRDSLPETAHEAIESEGRRGMSTAGAWVPLQGTPALFVALDLQSRGWAGSSHDRLRALQARTLRAAIDDELEDAVLGEPGLEAVAAPREPVVLIGGDLNLVGSRDPLLTLAVGRDGRLVVPASLQRIGEQTLATWQNPSDPFLPGRLDFLLLPPDRVELVSGFVFATGDLPQSVLDRLGLEASLSGTLSDHLVVVADLRIR